MIIWFVALSFALVLMVFDSPLLDYRLVMVGSVLPWFDFVWGPPWIMHSVFFPVAVMTLVMIIGWGRRLVQRRWLGLAIGLFLHLVLAATWVDGELFWWPVLGFDPDGRPAVPGPVLATVLELAGVVVAVWLIRRLGLAGPERRTSFLRTGHVDRSRLRP